MKKTFEVIKTVLTWLIVLLAVCMMVRQATPPDTAQTSPERRSAPHSAKSKRSRTNALPPPLNPM